MRPLRTLALLSSLFVGSLGRDLYAQTDTSLQGQAQLLQQLTQTAAEQQKTLEESLNQRSRTTDNLRQKLEEPQLKVDSLAARLGRLDSIQNANAMDYRKSLDISYNYGSKALLQIMGATRTVRLLQSSLGVEVAINQATNPWADNGIRNGWDKFNDWGVALGLGVAALGALAGNGDGRTDAIGAGATVALSSQLVGNIFGTKAKKRLAEKMAFLEFSRQAYEDLKEREALISSNTRRNDEFMADLLAFTIHYNSASTREDSAKIEVLRELDLYIVQFDATLRQVPGVLDLYETILAKYIQPPADTVGFRGQQVLRVDDINNGQLKTALLTIRSKLQALKIEYPNVRKFLDLTPTARAVLHQWETPLFLRSRPTPVANR